MFLMWCIAVEMVIGRKMSDAEVNIALDLYNKDVDAALVGGILMRRCPDTAHPYTG